ncbi:uncharacterized protein KNAG_0H02090 [Huiozyma naganishii CBS 8797]|uniref:HTH APSES-type domain-containing protein n=1 Tax=Huiozyma naganishii (strain ATCC MYA-139 / BCRC 22969 / CBS 8797 / KCTC 17520 / NBRC 10181 / NCYC 3082 / Yp74L-3) TaxID=1071383 RepID=J7RPI6_HUIN7|nr:hypothetical protein KNAG_0H02090 [Kazachstania naganishii CBS 8797]CCK71623.1 hypothetical protein KNAG_0H02090 [Kazachstania naganishii CBS 8797]
MFPFCCLDRKDVVLSQGPLDDYQRLCFATGTDAVVVQSSKDYKSNSANLFFNPGYMPQGSHTAQQHNVLHCFEYQLPTLKPGCAAERAGDDTHGLQITPQNTLLATVVSQDDEANRPTVQDSAVPERESGEKIVLTGADNPQRKSIYNLDVESGSISLSNNQDLAELSPTGGHGQHRNSQTITKNQQFKLNKLDYRLGGNDAFVNPNNVVLWTHDSGFVFLTGIWRLYQDVMRGLSTIDRVAGDSVGARARCHNEFDYVMNYAFYEPMEQFSQKNAVRKRKSSLTGGETSAIPIARSNSNSGNGDDNTTYTDLHWNGLSGELKVSLMEHFKRYLAVKYGFTGEQMADINISSVIQRIRGGYIKIQGTWLPAEIARQICARFCFPIRYLLVPVFGAQFPQECEHWQRIIERNTDIMIEVQSRQLNKTGVEAAPPTAPSAVKRKRKSQTTKQTPPRKRGRSLPDYDTIAKHQLSKNIHLPLPTGGSVEDNKLPPIGLLLSQLSKENPSFQPTSSYTTHTHYQHLPNTAPVVMYPTQRIVDPNPTVRTLSNLTTFYNTHGHRYSYPNVNSNAPAFSAQGATPRIQNHPQFPQQRGNHGVTFNQNFSMIQQTPRVYKMMYPELNDGPREEQPRSPRSTAEDETPRVQYN